MILVGDVDNDEVKEAIVADEEIIHIVKHTHSAAWKERDITFPGKILAVSIDGASIKCIAGNRLFTYSYGELIPWEYPVQIEKAVRAGKYVVAYGKERFFIDDEEIYLSGKLVDAWGIDERVYVLTSHGVWFLEKDSDKWRHVKFYMTPRGTMISGSDEKIYVGHSNGVVSVFSVGLNREGCIIIGERLLALHNSFCLTPFYVHDLKNMKRYLIKNKIAFFSGGRIITFPANVKLSVNTLPITIFRNEHDKFTARIDTYPMAIEILDNTPRGYDFVYLSPENEIKLYIDNKILTVEGRARNVSAATAPKYFEVRVALVGDSKEILRLFRRNEFTYKTHTREFNIVFVDPTERYDAIFHVSSGPIIYGDNMISTESTPDEIKEKIINYLKQKKILSKVIIRSLIDSIIKLLYSRDALTIEAIGRELDIRIEPDILKEIIQQENIREIIMGLYEKWVYSDKYDEKIAGLSENIVKRLKSEKSVHEYLNKMADNGERLLYHIMLKSGPIGIYASGDRLTFYSPSVVRKVENEIMKEMPYSADTKISWSSIRKDVRSVITIIHTKLERRAIKDWEFALLCQSRENYKFAVLFLNKFLMIKAPDHKKADRIWRIIQEWIMREEASSY